MRTLTFLAVYLGLVVQEIRLAAQVPHVLTYQGRVASGGTNFNGIGQFKFALVSGGTSAATQASATATVQFGFLVHITVTSGGAGYTTAPAVAITDSSGSGASAVAQIANGQVVGITVTDAGSGYSASPAITIAPPAMNLSYTTYWSHDGTSSTGGEPASVVPVSVSQGLFTVGLGDTMIPNMSALAPQVLANSDVRLRIWFNDGVNGFYQLSPDQRLTSTPYAMMADTVRDGAITAAKLASNSITSAQIAPGSVTAAQLADGAVTSAKLAPNVNLGPPSGTVAISTHANDTNLIAAGFLRMADTRVERNEWSVKPSSPVIRNLSPNAMLWTGNEVLTFGWGQVPSGSSYGFYGERYNPATNLRRLTSTDGAALFSASWELQVEAAVWTGTEAIIWGYTNAPNVGRPTYGVGYNPTTDSWRRLDIPNSLTNIGSPSVLWTGSELIVWAGAYYGGAKYNPDLGVWTPMSNAGAPDSSGPAVWTGNEMIVFGYNTAHTTPGRRYNPISNTWRTVSPNGAPTTEGNAQVLWTTSEAIYFGLDEKGPWGAMYDPARDAWRSMSLDGFYTFGQEEWPRPIWTGKTMAMLGGYQLLKASLYDPATDLWNSSNNVNPFSCDECYNGLSVWTGSELLFFNRGLYYRFVPAPVLYLYQKQ